MRLLVNLLLIIPTAAGPWVCCCTASALSGLPARVAKAVGLVPDSGTSGVCCGARTQGKEKHTPVGKLKSTSHGYRPAGDAPSEPHSCPCPSELRNAAPLSDGAESRPAELARGFSIPGQPLVEFVFLPPVSPDGRAAGAADLVSDLPFLTTDERLFFHHALRC
jgi:hypothetical protein